MIVRADVGWKQSQLVEPFDRGEFDPGTRGGDGICCFCMSPAAWMRFSLASGRGGFGRVVGLAYCDVHAADYTKHVNGRRIVEDRQEAVGRHLRIPEVRDGVKYVYYGKGADGRIKIGFSKDIRRRMMTLRTSLLAFEDGDGSVESIRHKQFAHLAEGGEWFRPAPELLAHIHALQELRRVAQIQQIRREGAA